MSGCFFGLRVGPLYALIAWPLSAVRLPVIPSYTLNASLCVVVPFPLEVTGKGERNIHKR